MRKKLAEEVVSVEIFLIPNISAISQRIAELLEVINAMPVEAEIVKQQRGSSAWRDVFSTGVYVFKQYKDAGRL